MNHPKPVLLLFAGAGFAAHAGAPLMKDFFDCALCRLPTDILTCIRAGFYFSQYALRGEPNLETAYGAMVFRQVVRGPDFRVATFERNDGHDVFVPARNGPTLEEVVGGFQHGIYCLYGQAVRENRDRWLGCYSQFFSYLLERYRVGVVTTNYDLVTETALQSVGRASTYFGTRAGCGFKDPIPILKLHGSVNWPQRSKLHLRAIGTDAEPVEEALVIPPTWNKALTSEEPICAVWRDAVALISTADVVLVIGHSFPATDMHLDYLFGEGMSKREGQPTHKRVTVVDPDVRTGASVCSRFDRYQTIGNLVLHKGRFEQLLSRLEEGSIVV